MIVRWKKGKQRSADVTQSEEMRTIATQCVVATAWAPDDDRCIGLLAAATTAAAAAAAAAVHAYSRTAPAARDKNTALLRAIINLFKVAFARHAPVNNAWIIAFLVASVNVTHTCRVQQCHRKMSVRMRLLSVRLSVSLTYRGRIDWLTWNVITSISSLGSSLV